MLFQQLPAFPSLSSVLVLLLLPAVVLLCRLPRSLTFVITVAVAGFLWAYLRAAAMLHPGLLPALEGEDLQVLGVIASLPVIEGRRARFEFTVDTITHQGRSMAGPSRLRLNWYNEAPPLRIGETWALTVRLKQPRGMSNPGTFDYEQWLFQNGIGAIGYVRQQPDNHRVRDNLPYHPLDEVRQRLREQFASTLKDSPTGGLITALAIGDRSGVTSEQWTLLAATGTSHLMAISGLHVGLVAGFAFWGVSRLLWGRILLRIPAPKAGAFAAIAAALVYAALAGFSIPTQRALIMVLVTMLAVLLQRPFVPLQALSLAFIAVLVADPLSVLAPGFWLSFGAVVFILYTAAGRLAGRDRWRWGRVQWSLSLGLLPVLVILFGQAAPSSPLANLVAIPWVGFLVVPFTLVGSVMLAVYGPLGELLIQAAAGLLELLWPLLTWMVEVAPAWRFAIPPLWTLFPALFGAAWLLAPSGWPARWIGTVWMLPLLLHSPPGPKLGEAWLTLLDVGQGLAVVVRTATHALVYDTGPSFGPDFDTGEAVVVPYLFQQGVRRVDLLVVSHGDNDHMGGVRSLRALMPVEQVVTSVPHKVEAAAACERGAAWSWDGVRFQILSPAHSQRAHAGNDNSCVLRVDTERGSFLLTGDIEAGAETELLHSGLPLAARVLIAPHHGSKTSSILPFVRAVNPEWVLFPVGYRNRYGFPHPSVEQRYRELGVKRLSSAEDGAITLRVEEESGALVVERYRLQQRHYWQTWMQH